MNDQSKLETFLDRNGVSKTTEIFTHVTTKNTQQITSTFDDY